MCSTYVIERTFLIRQLWELRSRWMMSREWRYVCNTSECVRFDNIIKSTAKRTLTTPEQKQHTTAAWVTVHSHLDQQKPRTSSTLTLPIELTNFTLALMTSSNLVSEMTYYVSSGTLNSTNSTHDKKLITKTSQLNKKRFYYKNCY